MPEENEILPVNEYSPTEEELVRISHYELIRNEDATAFDQVPIYLEDLGKKGRKKAIKKMKEYIFNKILEGSATIEEIESYKLLQQNA